MKIEKQSFDPSASKLKNNFFVFFVSILFFSFVANFIHLANQLNGAGPFSIFKVFGGEFSYLVVLQKLFFEVPSIFFMPMVLVLSLIFVVRVRYVLIIPLVLFVWMVTGLSSSDGGLFVTGMGIVVLVSAACIPVSLLIKLVASRIGWLRVLIIGIILFSIVIVIFMLKLQSSTAISIENCVKGGPHGITFSPLCFNKFSEDSNNDPNACGRIVDSEARAFCFTRFAVNGRDFNICKLLVESNLIDRCYSGYSDEVADSSDCFSMAADYRGTTNSYSEGFSFVDTCLGSVGFREKDTSVCMQISSTDQRNACVNEVQKSGGS